MQQEAGLALEYRAAVVAAPAKVWAPAPLMSRLAVPAPAVEAWLMFPWAARVPSR